MSSDFATLIIAQIRIQWRALHTNRSAFDAQRASTGVASPMAVAKADGWFCKLSRLWTFVGMDPLGGGWSRHTSLSWVTSSPVSDPERGIGAGFDLRSTKVRQSKPPTIESSRMGTAHRSFPWTTARSVCPSTCSAHPARIGQYTATAFEPMTFDDACDMVRSMGP